MPVNSPGKAVRFCNPETSSVCTIESVAFEKVTAQSLPVYYKLCECADVFFHRTVLPLKH